MKKLYDEAISKIEVTALNNKQADSLREYLRILPLCTLELITHVKNTLLGVTCTFGKTNSDGYIDVPKEVTHIFESANGDLNFAMPNHCLILPKEMRNQNLKLNLGK